ncbi:non-transporter ABC protein [Clostridium sp. Marseille-QA1073]
MSKVLYECKSCGKTFLYKKDKDGLNCNECKGMLVPLGYVNVIRNQIIKMQSKVESAKLYEPTNKEDKIKRLSVKISLDTTEVEKKLNRIEKQLERIKDLEDMLMFDKELNEVKNIIKGE